VASCALPEFTVVRNPHLYLTKRLSPSIDMGVTGRTRRTYNSPLIMCPLYHSDRRLPPFACRSRRTPDVRPLVSSPSGAAADKPLLSLCSVERHVFGGVSVGQQNSSPVYFYHISRERLLDLFSLDPPVLVVPRWSAARMVAAEPFYSSISFPHAVKYYQMTPLAIAYFLFICLSASHPHCHRRYTYPACIYCIPYCSNCDAPTATPCYSISY
jgi:hypothetical protein